MSLVSEKEAVTTTQICEGDRNVTGDCGPENTEYKLVYNRGGGSGRTYGQED